jgi:hypothetical protein
VCWPSKTFVSGDERFCAKRASGVATVVLPT